MYNKIYDFCKIRNKGTVYQNTDVPTPRVKFILELLESEGIDYELDEFPIGRGFIYDDDDFSYELSLFRRKKDRRRKPKPKPVPKPEKKGFNIILKGTSDKMVIAHHDIANPGIDNANDNSASVINAIMLKKLKPEVNIVLTDGEEMGGLGAKQLAKKINEGYFGDIKWVLNLELTGKGGKYFFIGDYPGELQDHIKSIFDCPIVRTPFNDSITLRGYDIDSVVINTLPPLTEGVSNVKYEDVFLEYKMVFNCHSNLDSLSSIDIADMKEFVETVLLKIV